MKLLITLYPGATPPTHSKPVFVLYKDEGDGYTCCYENGSWLCISSGRECEAPEFWFEVPSVDQLKNDAMITAVSEYEFEKYRGGADEGASAFS